MTNSDKSSDDREPEGISVREFFESIPPGRTVKIRNLAEKVQLTRGGKFFTVNFPYLKLHCYHDLCNGIRYFKTNQKMNWNNGTYTQQFISYTCRNCGKSNKTYAVGGILEGNEGNGSMFKYGEDPPFGAPTPAKVITLIGPERDYYLKGRQSENQGLGIAAFAYYRRVIENQKDRILDEIIRVSEKLNAPEPVLNDLKAAKREQQFSKAVEAVQHGIPQALLINGHNPLTLLHSALSEGLHAQSDEQCLELATSIRVVLTDLVDRMAHAVREEAELKQAVGVLLGSRKSKSKDGS